MSWIEDFYRSGLIGYPVTGILDLSGVRTILRLIPGARRVVLHNVNAAISNVIEQPRVVGNQIPTNLVGPNSCDNARKLAEIGFSQIPGLQQPGVQPKLLQDLGNPIPRAHDIAERELRGDFHVERDDIRCGVPEQQVSPKIHDRNDPVTLIKIPPLNSCDCFKGSFARPDSICRHYLEPEAGSFTFLTDGKRLLRWLNVPTLRSFQD